jgi:hypothetical protein
MVRSFNAGRQMKAEELQPGDLVSDSYGVFTIISVRIINPSHGGKGYVEFCYMTTEGDIDNDSVWADDDGYNLIAR